MFLTHPLKDNNNWNKISLLPIPTLYYNHCQNGLTSYTYMYVIVSYLTQHKTLLYFLYLHHVHIINRLNIALLLWLHCTVHDILNSLQPLFYLRCLHLTCITMTVNIALHCNHCMVSVQSSYLFRRIVLAQDSLTLSAFCQYWTASWTRVYKIHNSHINMKYQNS